MTVHIAPSVRVCVVMGVFQLCSCVCMIIVVLCPKCMSLIFFSECNVGIMSHILYKCCVTTIAIHIIQCST